VILRAACLLALASVPSCAIAWTRLYGVDGEGQARQLPRELSYSLRVSYGSGGGEPGSADTSPADPLSIEQWTKATDDALRELGFSPSAAADGSQAMLEIGIVVSPNPEWTTQGLITALSLGLIPTWQLNDAAFTYTFRDTSSGGSRVCRVGRTQLNHLIFLPVFWISFWTDADGYEEALGDFLLQSGRASGG
jgi:hypothetical protein